MSDSRGRAEQSSSSSLSPRPGDLLTGIFTRLNSHIMQVGHFGSDEVLEPTQNHPFWSVDRQDWVPSGELHIGERLRSPSGIVQIAWIGQKPGTHRVFNIEVEDAHSYLVGDGQVWVHNDCFTKIGPNGRLRNALSGEFVSQRTANTANHIFGPKSLSKHKLGGVLKAFDGNGIKATRAIEKSVQSKVERGYYPEFSRQLSLLAGRKSLSVAPLSMTSRESGQHSFHDDTKLTRERAFDLGH